jgi:predicted membrane protein
MRPGQGELTVEPTVSEPGGRWFTPQLLIGLLVILIGILFTLDNLRVIDAGDYLRYWPVGLIAIGGLKLWQSRGGRGLVAALVFTGAGIWLLLESARIVTVTLWDIWPMLLVFLGASLVWHGLRGRRERTGVDSSATISGLAVLGGIHRGNNSRAFRGGDLTAILGGCEIDLRQAAIEGEAVLDVFAMWGGIEIRVPEAWSVSGRVVPILGGFEDKTRPSEGATAHRLVVRGFAIMGGIEIKN